MLLAAAESAAAVIAVPDTLSWCCTLPVQEAHVVCCQQQHAQPFMLMSPAAEGDGFRWVCLSRHVLCCLPTQSHPAITAERKQTLSCRTCCGEASGLGDSGSSGAVEPVGLTAPGFLLSSCAVLLCRRCRMALHFVFADRGVQGLGLACSKTGASQTS